MLKTLAQSPVAPLILKPEEQDNPILRSRTGLVNLSVTVTDREQRPFAGLTAGNFEVYEDKVRQQIEYFSTDDNPLSIGIVFDVSGSMHGKMERALLALQAFLETSHQDDEYFLITFGEKPQLRLSQVQSDKLLSGLQGIKPEGDTPLFDAVFLGIEAMKQARHPKRALLVISDGADTSSRYNLRDLRKYIKETNLLIYSVGLPNQVSATCNKHCLMKARVALDDIATMTGGKAFFPFRITELEKSTTTIALELRQQYSLGYFPTNNQFDNQWRKIVVRVQPPDHIKEKLVVRTREGYYASP